jgi:nucleotide-binding universal stress UspA family protein
MIVLRRILVPVDFSKHSQQALRYGAAIADKFGAELYLLHVVQDVALFLPDLVTVAPPVLPPFEQLSAAVRDGLTRFLAENNLAGRAARMEVREGAPHIEIGEVAKDDNIDLIVMGTHGRGVLAHMLLGSVAEKVVRTAPCPVLTVRPGQHEFVTP